MNPTLPEILNIDAHLPTGPAEAVRTVLHSGANLNLVLWQIPPGAALPPHHHPTGADIWLILRGSGELIDDGPGPRRRLQAGDSVVVSPGQTHGVCNHGSEDCVLLSVIRPDAGFIKNGNGPSCP